MKVRVALGFYCHLAEASGFYEIPKNMLRVAQGERYNLQPFRTLDRVHDETGKRIAPNANKVLRDLAGHSATLGHQLLAEVFRDAFDPELRNGYSHADYVVWHTGIRVNVRQGRPREIPYLQFEELLNRGLCFFQVLQWLVNEYTVSYNPPKVIRGQLADEPENNWTLTYDSAKGSFQIRG